MKKSILQILKSQRKIAFAAAIVISTISLSACNRTNNPTPATEKPTINVESINKEVVSADVCGELQHNVIKTGQGSELILELSFHARNELSQYKVGIHENADCHDHGKRPLSEFSYSHIVELSGKDKTVTEKIPISEDADLTQYHFEIQVVDVAGTESAHTEYNLIIE